MKSTIAKFSGALLLAFALTGVSHATPITGLLTINGSVNLNASTLGAATGTTTAAFSMTETANTTPSGSFAAIPANSAVTFTTAAWMFNDPSTPIANFWTVDGFTFNLMSSAITGGNGVTTLSVTGMGTLTGPAPLSTTGGTYILSITDSGSGSSVTFGFTSSTFATIPDGGTTALLLGAALVGMTALSRRKAFQI